MPQHDADFDFTGLILRQSARASLTKLVISRRDAGWEAAADFWDGSSGSRRVTGAPNIEAAIVAALMPHARLPAGASASRVEDLEAALGELLGAVWDRLEAAKR